MIEQRTPEWFEQRRGKLTASNFGQALALIGSRQELWRIATDRKERWVKREAVDWGTALEPVALMQYVADTNYIVDKAGFERHPEIDWLGGSPDGIVSGIDYPAVGRWLLEIKCPFSQELWDQPPDYYIPQVQGLMAILDLPFTHFVCWTPSDYRVWHIGRSDEYWEWMLPKLAEFWTYVDLDVEPPRFKRGEKYSFDGQLEIERWH